MRRHRTAALGASLLALLVSACSTGGGSTSPSASEATRPAVTIGSEGFDESQLLAEIYAQALEAHGYTVTRQDFASRDLAMPALDSKAINILPEYIGSLVRFLGGEATGDTTATMTNLTAVLGPKNLTGLDAAPAQDGDGFVVRKETATQYSLVTMSDLAEVASQLKWGLPLECSSNPSCGPGLKDVYGIDIGTLQVENLGACSGEIATALNESGIDVAEVCTTQADIARYNFVLLQDDKKLIPAQNIAPIVRNDLLAAAPADLKATLNAVSAKLTTDELTKLNVRVSVNHETIKDVAAQWLSDQGLVT
ncbi:MAG: ABC transporter substrate-binding protein [Candidatus Limnocylindria bacterium]